VHVFFLAAFVASIAVMSVVVRFQVRRRASCKFSAALRRGRDITLRT